MEPTATETPEQTIARLTEELRRAKAAPAPIGDVRETIRLYFKRSAVVLPRADGESRVDYEEGRWYDGVSPDHVPIVGDAAIPLTLNLACGHLELPDGRIVVTRTREKTIQRGPEDPRGPGADQVPYIDVTIEPHTCRGRG